MIGGQGFQDRVVGWEMLGEADGTAVGVREAMVTLALKNECVGSCVEHTNLCVLSNRS